MNSSPTQYDLIVSGGGSAGLATAIKAAQSGMRVLVLDAAGVAYDKPCGEGVMPLGLSCIKALGIELKDGINLDGIIYKFPDRQTVKAHFHTHQSAVGLRRSVLRPLLWSKAKAMGIQIIHRAVHTYQVNQNSIVVENFTTKYWVIAEGIKSKNARALGLVKQGTSTNRFALRRHVNIKPWTKYVEVYWHDDCEAYVTPVSDTCVNIAVLSFKSRTFVEHLDLFPELKENLNQASFATEISGTGPLLHRTNARKLGNIFLVGDAAGFVDPMTGEGNSLALASGIACADAIVRGRGYLYPLVWYSIVWRYWIVTRLSLWLTMNPKRRQRTLDVIKKHPQLLQLGLNFLTGLK